MRLLLDTHVILALLDRNIADLHSAFEALVEDAGTTKFASVASLWEIAIKTRLGKLRLAIPLHELPQMLVGLGLTILPITAAHALAEVEPAPATRDPFDGMLVAQASVEALQLLTADRALAGHPLAWRPF